MSGASDIAVVVIGRNEGARLIASLTSLQGHAGRVIYVDSGSTDNSLNAARGLGAEVIELDLSQPFTAARARNAGFFAMAPAPPFVQFIDGDCILEPGWIEAGVDALAKNPDMGIVTGWRSEIHPDASIYNSMAEVEWHRPPGDIEGCGGDMMVRSDLFGKLGGFNPRVIAAEDEEFCTRVRKAGYRVHRLPLSMTRHDADIHRFGQWWQRTVRAGHGFAQVGRLHPEYFARERKRVWFYGAALPAIAAIGVLVSPWLLAVSAAAYAFSYVRTARGLQANGLTQGKALHQAAFLTLSKLPNLLGILKYHWRAFRRQDMVIIEYK